MRHTKNLRETLSELKTPHARVAYLARLVMSLQIENEKLTLDFRRINRNNHDARIANVRHRSSNNMRIRTARKIIRQILSTTKNYGKDKD